MAVKKQEDYPPHVKLMMEPEDEVFREEEDPKEWLEGVISWALGSSQNSMEKQ